MDLIKFFYSPPLLEFGLHYGLISLSPSPVPGERLLVHIWYFHWAHLSNNPSTVERLTHLDTTDRRGYFGLRYVYSERGKTMTYIDCTQTITKIFHQDAKASVTFL